MKSHLQRQAIYIGGAAGPFSGQALTSVLENVSATFAIPVDAASLGITAYLAPFAVMMLFSFRLVQGRRLDRVVFAGYSVIVAAVLAGIWAVAIVGTQTLQTTVNVDVLSNPATVTLISTVQAFRFIGVAAAPLVVLPLYLSHGAWTYALSAAVLTAAVALQLAFGQRNSPDACDRMGRYDPYHRER